MGSILSNSKLLIDTNILIDFLKEHQKAVTFLTHTNKSLLFSSITVAELYSGVRDQREEKQIDELISRFEIIEVTSSIAKMGGLIKKEYNPSHGTGIADAVIAASALKENAKLITLNLKQFPMVEKKESPY